MADAPDIVKALRQEEKLGVLTSKVETAFEEPMQVEEESEVIENSVKITEESEIDDSEENMYNDVTKLRKKCDELENKLKESKERYNSLAEYFEILSCTTTALGARDLFSDVSDIIFQVSPNGRITYINLAIEKITNYNSSTLIGEKISLLIPKSDWKKIHKKLFSGFKKKNFMNREFNNFETVVTTKDGEVIPVEINGKTIQNKVEVLGRKNDISIQGSIRDITERKRIEEERFRNAKRLEEMNKKLQIANADLNKAQEELHLLNQNLEKKVEERTVEIQKLLKHKDEFIGQLGHDLKSPLTPLVGLLPTIQAKEKDPKLKELLEVANRNIIYMRDLVTKTLKLERLNHPTLKLNFEGFNLFESVEKNVINKEFTFKNKSLKIENKINKNLMIYADKMEFNELVDNIFTNAIKFTPEKGRIVFKAEKKNDFVKISISDSGVGLTTEHIEHIFEEFYKVDPSRHDLDSSGLGLSICKRIVEKHNGEIWAESPGIGKGSTFNFTLPTNNKK